MVQNHTDTSTKVASAFIAFIFALFFFKCSLFIKYIGQINYDIPDIKKIQPRFVYQCVSCTQYECVLAALEQCTPLHRRRIVKMSTFLHALVSQFRMERLMSSASSWRWLCFCSTEWKDPPPKNPKNQHASCNLKIVFYDSIHFSLHKKRYAGYRVIHYIFRYAVGIQSCMQSSSRHRTGSVKPRDVPFSASLFYWREKNGAVFGAFCINTLCCCRPCIKINARVDPFCQGFFFFTFFLSCETRHVLCVNDTPPTLGTQSRPLQVINFDMFPREWNLPLAKSRHKAHANNCGRGWGGGAIALVRCSVWLVVSADNAEVQQLSACQDQEDLCVMIQK